MKTLVVAVLAIAVMAVVVGSNLRLSAASPKPATADTLRQLEAEFMKAAAARGAEGYMS